MPSATKAVAPSVDPQASSVVTLTPEQEKAWTLTRQLMGWKCPGFRYLWFTLLSHDNKNGKSDYAPVLTRHISIAATDDYNIMINPDKFFEFDPNGRVFIAAHEILHAMFGDCAFLQRCIATGKVPMNDGSSLPFDNATMQAAMDLRNNQILINSNIGKPPVDKDGKTIGIFGGQNGYPVVTGEEPVVDNYRQLYENPPDDLKGGQPGGFDTVLPPGNSVGIPPQQAMQQRNPQQWQVAIKMAQHFESLTRSQGKFPAALQRMFEKLLEPEVYWLDHIEMLIARNTGGGTRSWNKPDPWFIGRDIYLPHKTGFGAGWIVMWGDTSGSRSDKEISSNMSEISAILEDVRPKRLTVLWCDADIDYVDELEDPSDLERIIARGTKGGGGTSVHPVMAWIADQIEQPELFIGFTDGEVTFPDKEPNFPVIWASSTDHEYPWGQVVRVNKPQHGN